MQSFASPPHHNPPHRHKKGRNYRSYLRPFYPKNHRKGATIAYTHALSTQKSIERAQLSLIPTPFPPKNPQKGRNYRCTSRKICENLC